MSAEPEKDLREVVADAERERLSGAHDRALYQLIRVVSQTPTPEARLLLVRVLFESGCSNYALKELELLCQSLPERETLVKLYQALGGIGDPRNFRTGASASQETLLATTEINLESLEALDQET